MKREVVFAYPCPVCRKTLQSPVQYLGRKVNCRYCDSEFVARDPQLESAAMLQPVDRWTPTSGELNINQTEQSRRPR